MFVRNSGAGNGCANFMDAWKHALFLQEKPCPQKFLVFFGGVFWVFWGAGECRFHFYGLEDFSDKWVVAKLQGDNNTASVCRAMSGREVAAMNQHPNLPWSFVTLVARAIRKRDSGESIRANHSQLKPFFYSTSGRFAWITRISGTRFARIVRIDSRESRHQVC